MRIRMPRLLTMHMSADPINALLVVSNGCKPLSNCDNLASRAAHMLTECIFFYRLISIFAAEMPFMKHSHHAII